MPPAATAAKSGGFATGWRDVVGDMGLDICIIFIPFHMMVKVRLTLFSL